jgi:protein-S-isoprenylcysteine O-methyltransferase Ste14
MQKRLSRFGVGPRIVAAALLYAALAGLATHAWPDICVLRGLPAGACRAAAVILALIGIPMWVMAVVSVMRAYDRDQLVTSGVFGLCRHPVYAAWIVFLLPALALPTRSWPLMLTPLAAYAVFRAQIHHEEDYLQERFGPAYSAYRARVNAIFPIPKL